MVGDRSQGLQRATIQALAIYWVGGYDWRAGEAKLNALPQFTTEIDGLAIHFIHVKSRHEDALPVVITHGWPGSVIEMLEVVGPLTDPEAHFAAWEEPQLFSEEVRACFRPQRNKAHPETTPTPEGGHPS